MARVTSGTTAKARHDKVIKAAKGYYGRRKNIYRVAKQAVDKARQYAYRDAVSASVKCALCGFSGSMPRCGFTA